MGKKNKTQLYVVSKKPTLNITKQMKIQRQIKIYTNQKKAEEATLILDRTNFKAGRHIKNKG